MQAFIWQKNYTWDLNICVSYVLQVLQLSSKYRNGFTSENLLRVFGGEIFDRWPMLVQNVFLGISEGNSVRKLVHCFRIKCKLSSFFIVEMAVKRKSYIHNWPFILAVHHVRWNSISTAFCDQWETMWVICLTKHI